MVCTNDADLYETVRMLRAHGMVRELDSDSRKRGVLRTSYPDLNPDFIFAHPGYNVRSTEINAVIGRSQLQPPRRQHRAAHREPACSSSQQSRPGLYRTDFATEGSSNYAFTLILRAAGRRALCQRVMATLREQRRRVPPRHRGRRQPGAPAVPAPAGSGRMPGSRFPRRGPRPFLRLLHRQLSDAGARQDSAAVRAAQRSCAKSIA